MNLELITKLGKINKKLSALAVERPKYLNDVIRIILLNLRLMILLAKRGVNA